VVKKALLGGALIFTRMGKSCVYESTLTQSKSSMPDMIP